jgi:acyl-CoA-binding protein
MQGLDDEQKTNLYGLYKQGTIGDINIPQPWSIQIVESAKWYATGV